MVALIRGPERASWLAKDRLLVVTFQMYGRFLPTFIVKKSSECWCVYVCIYILYYYIGFKYFLNVNPRKLGK